MDFIGEGKIPFLWVNPQSVATTLPDSAVLFELVFNKKDNFINEDIALSSDITEINAFDGNYVAVGIVKADGMITENINKKLNIYPNPVSNMLTINCSHISMVQIIDNMGKVVKVVSLKDATNPILSVGGLAKGVYHLRIQTTDGKLSTINFVKE